ncbi:hypothetical protein GCM10023336_38180 [Streptomyces similanensis]|uniref:Uncharacterized protein n=1 Tax=Streptomyces similanensis TaxID=1274988 RepID=A0ABP9KKX1_9ACTN
MATVYRVVTRNDEGQEQSARYFDVDGREIDDPHLSRGRIPAPRNGGLWIRPSLRSRSGYHSFPEPPCSTRCGGRI